MLCHMIVACLVFKNLPTVLLNLCSHQEKEMVPLCFHLGWSDMCGVVFQGSFLKKLC